MNINNYVMTRLYKCFKIFPVHKINYVNVCNFSSKYFFTKPTLPQLQACEDILGHTVYVIYWIFFGREMY